MAEVSGTLIYGKHGHTDTVCYRFNAMSTGDNTEKLDVDDYDEAYVQFVSTSSATFSSVSYAGDVTGTGFSDAIIEESSPVLVVLPNDFATIGYCKILPRQFWVIPTFAGGGTVSIAITFKRTRPK